MGPLPAVSASRGLAHRVQSHADLRGFQHIASLLSKETNAEVILPRLPWLGACDMTNIDKSNHVVVFSFHSRTDDYDEVQIICDDRSNRREEYTMTIADGVHVRNATYARIYGKWSR